MHLGSVEGDDRHPVGFLIQQGFELDLTYLLIILTRSSTTGPTHTIMP
jgi:hypothetical protein